MSSSGHTFFFKFVFRIESEHVKQVVAPQPLPECEVQSDTTQFFLATVQPAS